LTQVLDFPHTGRQFFEQVIRENIDLGRPDRVQLIFGRQVTRRTPGTFCTRAHARFFRAVFPPSDGWNVLNSVGSRQGMRYVQIERKGAPAGLVPVFWTGR
jgi:hypothetical protein